MEHNPRRHHLSSATYINTLRAIILMRYRTVLELLQMAQRYGLLGSPFVRTALRVLAVDDDPELEQDVASYIARRALDTMYPRYR